MRKIFLFLFIFLMSCAFAKTSLKGSVESYSDLFEYIELTEEQENQMLRIRSEEEQALKPYILDICAKEDAIELLKNSKCKIIDRTCKKRLKADIKERRLEQDEALSKIDRKKRYYEIRYKNILTRKQNLEYQNLKKTALEQDKALSDTQRREKRQARIDRMKVWRKLNIKLPDVKIPEIKYINPKGVETGS